MGQVAPDRCQGVITQSKGFKTFIGPSYRFRLLKSLALIFQVRHLQYGFTFSIILWFIIIT